MISIIAAASKNGVIGKDNALPWHIPEDLKNFKYMTVDQPIIMGRKTWESLPKKPLPNRINYVITRKEGYVADGAKVFNNLPDAIFAASIYEKDICIIGGAQVYAEALHHGIVDVVFLTRIHTEIDGDAFFPEGSLATWQHTPGDIYEHEGLKYSFDVYKKRI